MPCPCEQNKSARLVVAEGVGQSTTAQCSDGDFRTANCSDGSFVITHVCVDGVWKETGDRCVSPTGGMATTMMLAGVLLLGLLMMFKR